MSHCWVGVEFSFEIIDVVHHTGSNVLGILKPGCHIKANGVVRRIRVTAKNAFRLYDFEDRRGEFPPADGKDAQGTDIWCADMLAQEYVGDSTIQIYPHGLALQRMEKSDGEHLRRVGTFKMGAGTDRQDWSERIERRVLTIY